MNVIVTLNNKLYVFGEIPLAKTRTGQVALGSKQHEKDKLVGGFLSALKEGENERNL